MSKRHNDHLIAAFDDDNVVRESAKNEALRTFSAGISWHERKRKETVFYYINGSFNRCSKLSTEALSLFFIPDGRCFGFLNGLLQNSNRALAVRQFSSGTRPGPPAPPVRHQFRRFGA